MTRPPGPDGGVLRPGCRGRCRVSSRGSGICWMNCQPTPCSTFAGRHVPKPWHSCNDHVARWLGPSLQLVQNARVRHRPRLRVTGSAAPRITVQPLMSSLFSLLARAHRSRLARRPFGSAASGRTVGRRAVTAARDILHIVHVYLLGRRVSALLLTLGGLAIVGSAIASGPGGASRVSSPS